MPGPCTRSLRNRTFRSPGERLWLFVPALLKSFDRPPFQLLEHLFTAHLAFDFAIAQHHRRAAASAHAASHHQAHVAVLRRLPLGYPELLLGRRDQLVGTLDVAGSS